MAASAPGLSSGLRIMEAIVESESGIGFNQLKTAAELSAASLNRYLQVLLEQQYVEKDANQQYVAGPMLFALMQRAEQHHGLRGASGPVLDSISREAGCTALWIDYRHGRMLCRDKRVHPEGIAMQQTGEIRTDYPLHPWGFLLLAHADEATRRLYLEHADNGALALYRPDAEALDRYIANAAERGLADDQGAILPHIRRIAVPVYDGERLAAAIAVGMPGTSFDAPFIHRLYELLQDEAAQVMKLLQAAIQEGKGEA